MDYEFKRIVNMAEKQNWVVYDWQPGNKLISFVKEGLIGTRITIWVGRKGTTIELQYILNGAIKHRYIRKANDSILKRVFKEYVGLINSLWKI